jgi:hypothetical protein
MPITAEVQQDYPELLEGIKLVENYQPIQSELE